MRKAWEVLLKGIGKINNWIAVFAGACIFIMVVTTTREVMGRYLFNAPTDWILVLCQYLMVTVAFLGAAYTLEVGGHVSVDLLYTRFSPRAKRSVSIVISLIVLCVASIFTWQCWEFAWGSLQAGAVSGEAVPWPLFPVQVMMPIGSFLLCLACISRIYHNISHKTY